MDSRRPTRIRKNRVLHPCPQCGKAFTKRSNMLIHARLHTGEKPYVCKYAGCGRSYKWLSSINFHEGRCDKRSAGLAVPAPRPPPPPAAAEAARVAAAAAAAASAAAAAAATNTPPVAPLHSPHLQPLPSYQSLQRTTQSHGLTPPPPPPPPPLRPPPQFSPQHQLQHQPHQQHQQHHSSFPQAILPTHAQQSAVQPLPFSNHPPAVSPPPPNAQPAPFHHPHHLFHTPRKGKRFRPQITPLSPVTPHQPPLPGPAVVSYPPPPPSMRPLCGLTNTLGVKSSISNVSADHIHLPHRTNLDDQTHLITNIVGLSSAKRMRCHATGLVPIGRHPASSATTCTIKYRTARNTDQAPGSPDSATSQEVKEMLAPYVPYSLLGGTLGDMGATTSETTKAESVVDHQHAMGVKLQVKQEAREVRDEPKGESRLEIGDSFGFEDDDFLQNCGMGNVFDDLDRDAYGITLEQCSTDSDALPMFR